MVAAHNFEDYRRADVRFHIGVAEAAPSPRLVTALTEVHGDLSDLIGGHRILRSPSRTPTFSTTFS